MRLLLPPGTEVGRKIPKSKFYEKLQAGSNLKELFVHQVESVIWAHNLSPRTVNLEATAEVEEIQIFEIELRQPTYSVEILRAIDRSIPYPILYVLRYEEEFKLAIAYKERSGNDENRSVVRSYHETPWQQSDPEAAEAQKTEFHILQGFDLRAVYDHMIRTLVLAASERPIWVEGSTQRVGEDNCAEEVPLELLLERQGRIDHLRRDCAKLESKMAREKQFNRRVELNMELQKKRQELERLSQN